jgi:flagellar assembly protein FliH
MMSSSRILKGATRKNLQIAEFSFDALHEEGITPLPGTAEHFQPLFTEAPVTTKGTSHPAAHGQCTNGEPGEDISSPGVEELQRLLQDSCDKGFADGRREAEESFNGVCRVLSEAISEMNGLRERIIRECEDDLLRLAMMVAKQVVRQEITQDRKILANFVLEATSGISEQNEIVICFHPEDFRAVSANRQLFLAGVDDKMQITIKPDESVTLGGCVVETQTGQVDARVESQLEEIFKRLMQERGHGCDEPIEMSTEAELYLAKHSGAEKYGYQQD